MRNALCDCGSGLKYKKCCGAAGAAPKSAGAAQPQFRYGVQLLQSGQVSAAIAVLHGLIQSDPGHFDAHQALGAALMESGQVDQAGAVWSRAVALRPNSAEAHRDLGFAYYRLGLHAQAIAAWRRAVVLAPKLGDVHYRLSELYAMAGQMAEAADSLERAADTRRNTTMERLYRADARLMRGDMAGAEQWARKAVALDPKSDATHGALAGIMFAQGRFDEAAAGFETCLRINPGLAKAWDGLARCRKYRADDTDIPGRMHGVLQRADLPESDRMTMHFALGKVYDDAGDYARAMEQFDIGNRLRARGPAFDRAGMAASVDRAIALFTSDFMARHGAGGLTDDIPLFIVGMYRSGTTLVEQIVSSHPGIAAGGELTVWAPGEIDFNEHADPVQMREAATKYVAALHKISPDAARVTDKLPFNFLRLGAIHALMPHARIIHCKRNPIDTCLSIYATLFNTPVSFAASKEDLVFCYRQYLRIMAHWRHVLPADIFLEVAYERLIAEREAETRRLIAFTGLAWDDRCLRPEHNIRAISTSSAWQARQPVYPTSVQRWRHYAPWLGELHALLSADA
jgi:tetratricopeptide (TPR) repeat protein